MATTSVDFAKIGSTPTSLSWSHSYHAGNLFAVISLTKLGESQLEEPISAIGKTVMSTLEEEYFTLEEKTFDAILEALLKVQETIPEELNTFLACGTIISLNEKDILYLFLKGNGSAIIKRGKDIVTLLKNTQKLEGISGVLQDNDYIVVQSAAFESAIPKEILQKALLKPHSEIPETLGPILQEKEETGAAASIVIAYRSLFVKVSEEKKTATKELPPQRLSQKEETGETRQPNKPSKLPFRLPKLSVPISKFRLGILLAIILLGGIFAFNIVSSLQGRKEAAKDAKAQEILSSAQKKYDEGQALVSLNKNLANDDFLAAKKILEEGKTQFPPTSKQYQKLDQLLQKVNSQASNASGATLISATQVDASKSPLLSYEQSAKESTFTQDAKIIYGLDTTQINAIDKNTNKSKQIIKNDSDWTTALGISTYNGNLYVLDPKNVLKYVQGDDGYGKSSYFSADKPDLSQAMALTIDTSVYILFKDGSIQKFTRGKADTFKLNGVTQAFKNPTKLITNTDMDSLYVLDNDNARIVVLSKEGNFQTQYQAAVLKDAKDIDVLEKDKKIYVLSGGKIWQIDLK